MEKRTNPGHHSALVNRGISDIYRREELLDVITFGHHAQASFQSLELDLLRTWDNARSLHVLYREHCASRPRKSDRITSLFQKKKLATHEQY